MYMGHTELGNMVFLNPEKAYYMENDGICLYKVNDHSRKQLGIH